MKLQTLIEILFILLARKKVTATYLANKFGVTTRTIYRYIDELSIPVPIYNERGRNGGFTIADTFKLPAVYFTEEEKTMAEKYHNMVYAFLNSKGYDLEEFYQKIIEHYNYGENYYIILKTQCQGKTDKLCYKSKKNRMRRFFFRRTYRGGQYLYL